MDTGTPRFSVGIEEEYLLVERDSRDLCNRPKEAMIEQMQQRGLPPGVAQAMQAQRGGRPGAAPDGDEDPRPGTYL